jgi:hypothetical protein
MSIHKPFNSTIVLLPSAPLTSGGSLDLANGQIGLFQKGKRTSRGIGAVSSLTNLSGNDKVFLEIGTGSVGHRGALTNKNMKTLEFHPKDVLDVSFSQAKEPTASSVIIGYDGHDITRSLSLKPGQAASITVELSGDIVAFYGKTEGKYRKTFTFNTELAQECEELDVCDLAIMKPIVEDVVARAKATQFLEGILLGDLLTIRGIYSDAAPAGTSTATFYTLTLADSGDDNALGLVQATVQGSKVIRTDRTGLDSTYEVVSSTGAPSHFSKYFPSLLTGCAACPDNYTASASGFLYNLMVDDAGVDIEATLLDSVAILTEVVGQVKTVTNDAPTGTDITNAVYTGIASTATSGAGTGATWDITVAGTDVTSVVLNAVGSGYAVGDTVTVDYDEGALDGTTGSDITITITAVNTVASSVTKTGNTHDVGKYALIFPTELTSAEVASLMAAYPASTYEAQGEVIGVCVYTGEAVNSTWVEGEECLMISEDYYIDLKDDECGSARLAEVQANYPELTVEVDGDFTPPEGSCFTRYKTSVISNIVCEHCFPDNYTTSSPSEFENESWVKVAGAASDNTVLTGIFFEPKEFVICPDKAIADQLQTIVEPMEVQVSGGEIEGTQMGYGYNKNAFPVRRLGRAFRGSGFGIDYMYCEQETYARMLGLSIGNGYVENYLKDMVCKLQPCEKYDAITLKVRGAMYNNGFSHKSYEEVRYVFVIPQGTKALYTDFFNSIAAGNADAGNI